MGREEIIGKITNMLCVCTMTPDGERNPCPTCQYYGEEIGKVADWHLAEVKRICRPGIAFRLSRIEVCEVFPENDAEIVIEEILKRAQLE